MCQDVQETHSIAHISLNEAVTQHGNHFDIFKVDLTKDNSRAITFAS